MALVPSHLSSVDDSTVERLPSWYSRLPYVEEGVERGRSAPAGGFVPTALPLPIAGPPITASPANVESCTTGEEAASDLSVTALLSHPEADSARACARVRSQHPYVPSGTSAEMRTLGFQAVSLRVNRALAEGIFRVVVDAYAKVGGAQFATVDEFIADVPVAFVVREKIGSSAAEADLVTAFLGAKQTPSGAKFTVVAASGEEAAVRGRQAVREFLSQLARGGLPAAYIEVRGPTLSIMSRAVASALASASAGDSDAAAIDSSHSVDAAASGAAALVPQPPTAGAALIPVDAARVLLPGKELLPLSDADWEAAKACRDAPRGLDPVAEAVLRAHAYVRVIKGLGPKVKVMFGCLRRHAPAAAAGPSALFAPLAAVDDSDAGEEAGGADGPAARPQIPGLHASRSAPY